MTKIPAVSLLCIVLAMVAVLPGRLQARLGGNVESIESDRKTFSAVQRSVSSDAAYTVHTIDNGATVIREYASSEGVVFGIAWEGTRTPDLETLLGSYFPEYNQALADASRVPGARHRSVRANDVVVDRWGQVGNIQGRAYAPALIPNGVNIDEIK